MKSETPSTELRFFKSFSTNSSLSTEFPLVFVGARRQILPRQKQPGAILGRWLTSASLPTQQFRVASADVFHVGMTSAADVDTMVSNLAAGHHNAVIQGSSDLTNWLNLEVTRGNRVFGVIDPITNSPWFYRTKSEDEF